MFGFKRKKKINFDLLIDHEIEIATLKMKLKELLSIVKKIDSRIYDNVKKDVVLKLKQHGVSKTLIPEFCFGCKHDHGFKYCKKHLRTSRIINRKYCKYKETWV